MQKPNRLVADYLDFYMRKQTDIDKSFLIRGMAEKLLFISLRAYILFVNDKK